MWGFPLYLFVYRYGLGHDLCIRHHLVYNCFSVDLFRSAIMHGVPIPWRDPGWLAFTWSNGSVLILA